MATIAIVPWVAPANLLVTLALARKLQRRGHRVVFVSIADHGPTLRAQGFEFVPFLQRYYPPGVLRALATATAKATAGRPAGHARRGLLDRVRRARAAARAWRSYFAGTDLAANLRRANADLFVVHHEHLWVARACRALGFPTLLQSSMLPFAEDPRVPPLTSPLVPRDDALTRARVLLAWKLRTARHLAANWATLDYELRDTRLARARDFACLVFCPAEFDFVRADARRFRYVEPSIDLARRDEGLRWYSRGPRVPFPWHRLDDRRPLVLATLGTVAWSRREASTRFFRAVLGAAALDRRFQLVAATGEHHAAEDFADAPADAIVVPWAPQLELLPRAAVTVCHAGANTVKESVYFGVPLVVVPMHSDHPGNAARVVHHGLGVAGTAEALSPEAVRAMIAAVLDEPRFKARAEAMGRRFREVEAAAPSVTVIEETLATGRAAANP